MIFKGKFKKILILIIILFYTENNLNAKKTNNYHIQTYGQEKLKTENEEFIKNLIKEFSMENYNIKIYKMNSTSIKQMGYKNAFVISNLLYISENFFEELTHDAKRFIIAHELMHIKNNHGGKQIIISIASIISTITLYITLSDYIDKNYLSPYLETLNINKRFKKFISSKFIVLPSVMTLSKLIQKAFSRQCEKEADEQAALNLKSIKGAIDLFNEYPKIKKNKILAFIKSFLSTHPSMEERIKLLKKIESKINNQLINIT